MMVLLEHIHIYFNPRSPCGERPTTSPRTTATIDFNPRSPCGERLIVHFYYWQQRYISIHAPRAGSDSR